VRTSQNTLHAYFYEKALFVKPTSGGPALCGVNANCSLPFARYASIHFGEPSLRWLGA
jgi:hypothetical protein